MRIHQLRVTKDIYRHYCSIPGCVAQEKSYAYKAIVLSKIDQAMFMIFHMAQIV
jgi:hypothetical protein